MLVSEFELRSVRDRFTPTSRTWYITRPLCDVDLSISPLPPSPSPPPAVMLRRPLPSLSPSPTLHAPPLAAPRRESRLQGGPIASTAEHADPSDSATVAINEAHAGPNSLEPQRLTSCLGDLETLHASDPHHTPALVELSASAPFVIGFGNFGIETAEPVVAGYNRAQPDLNSSATPWASTFTSGFGALHTASTHYEYAPAAVSPLEVTVVDRKNFERVASTEPVTVAVNGAPVNPNLGELLQLPISASDLETLHTASAHRARASAAVPSLEPAAADRKNSERVAPTEPPPSPSTRLEPVPTLSSHYRFPLALETLRLCTPPARTVRQRV